MPPRATIWPIDEHTRGKHLVLQRYLNAWLPILAQSRGRIVFIDAFAGPGRYSNGEPGSPIIALRALKQHLALPRLKGEIILLFVEDSEARYRHLESEVAVEREGLPSSVITTVEHGKFHQVVGSILDYMEKKQANLAPSFMMVDPFGVSECPMSVIQRFLRHASSEVLATFMVEFIDRFDATGEFPPHLDELFGTDAWRRVDTTAPKAARIAAYCDLYETQLRAAGAGSVLRFDLYSGSRLEAISQMP